MKSKTRTFFTIPTRDTARQWVTLMLAFAAVVPDMLISAVTKRRQSRKYFKATALTIVRFMFYKFQMKTVAIFSNSSKSCFQFWMSRTVSNGSSERFLFNLDIQFSPFQAFNCSCIGSAVNGTQAAAVKGYCDRGPGCKNFTYFLVISFALLLAVFLTAIPNKTVVLR